MLQLLSTVKAKFHGISPPSATHAFHIDKAQWISTALLLAFFSLVIMAFSNPTMPFKKTLKPEISIQNQHKPTRLRSSDPPGHPSKSFSVSYQFHYVKGQNTVFNVSARSRPKTCVRNLYINETL